MDASSLYTNIPHNEGILAVKHFLSKSNVQHDIPTLLRLTELVLQLSSFSYTNLHYKQIRGVAMGTKMGPSYACLFVGLIEERVFDTYSGKPPCLFKRYIDDCFGIFTGPQSDLLLFIDHLSNFHPALSFTHTISTTSIPFLDILITVSPDSDTLSTTVYYKQTDSHAYLNFSSSHPRATRVSLPYSQMLRLRRLCSSNSDFELQAERMQSFFLDRGFPDHIVSKAHDKAKNVPRSEALSSGTKHKHANRIPLALTFHPHNVHVKRILLDNFHILQSDPVLGSIFDKPPLVAYKRDRNLRDHLVRARSSTSALPPGNFSCQKQHCISCPFLSNTHKIVGPKGTFSVRSHFTCQSTDLVYILRCLLCNQLYVGETYRTLHDRFEEHHRDIRLSHSTPVARHFNSKDHKLTHLSVTALWQNHTDPLQRKWMEDFLIVRLGTLAPLGINAYRPFPVTPSLPD